MRWATDQRFSPSLPPSHPLSLKINKILKKERQPIYFSLGKQLSGAEGGLDYEGAREAFLGDAGVVYLCFGWLRGCMHLWKPIKMCAFNKIFISF